jgi:hypothetical protein
MKKQERIHRQEEMFSLSYTFFSLVINTLNNYIKILENDFIQHLELIILPDCAGANRKRREPQPVWLRH